MQDQVLKLTPSRLSAQTFELLWHLCESVFLSGLKWKTWIERALSGSCTVCDRRLKTNAGVDPPSKSWNSHWTDTFSQMIENKDIRQLCQTRRQLRSWSRQCVDQQHLDGCSFRPIATVDLRTDHGRPTKLTDCEQSVLVHIASWYEGLEQLVGTKVRLLLPNTAVLKRWYAWSVCTVGSLPFVGRSSWSVKWHEGWSLQMRIPFSTFRPKRRPRSYPRK